MMPETIGDRLKNARAERQLSIEQAARATKIKEKYLEALENNRRDILPSGVQGRGFLRLYAGYLEVPTQPLLDAWENDGVIIEPPSPQAEELPEDTPPAAQPSIATGSQISIDPSLPAPPSQSEDQPPSTSPPTADRIFQEIGLELKQRREKLALKLADIERFTMVRQHYLEALESGKLEELPSLVQARGMLNNYAHFLELDTEKILLKYASALQQRRLENQGASPSGRPRRKPSKKAGSWKMLITPDLIIGAVLTVSLLVFALWGVAQITASRSEQPDSGDLIALPESMLATPELLATPTLPELQPTQNLEDDREQSGEDGAEPTVEEQSTEFVSLAPLQLNIIANQRAYLRIISDGKTAFNGRVVPGNAYSFSAERQIELLTGSAGAIQVFYNQNDLGVLGVVGEVANRIFTIGGIITPTPQFTPTPTETLVPTLTPLPSPTVLTPTVTPFIP